MSAWISAVLLIHFQQVQAVEVGGGWDKQNITKREQKKKTSNKKTNAAVLFPRSVLSAVERGALPRCFAAVLTFKSSQRRDRAAPLKNNQFPSLRLTLPTLDHYHCGTLRQFGMHRVHTVGTMQVQRGERVSGRWRG